MPNMYNNFGNVKYHFYANKADLVSDGMLKLKQSDMKYGGCLFHCMLQARMLFILKALLFMVVTVPIPMSILLLPCVHVHVHAHVHIHP